MDSEVCQIKIEVMFGIQAHTKFVGKVCAGAGDLAADIAHEVDMRAVIDQEVGWRAMAKVSVGNQADVFKYLKSAIHGGKVDR